MLFFSSSRLLFHRHNACFFCLTYLACFYVFPPIIWFIHMPLKIIRVWPWLFTCREKYKCSLSVHFIFYRSNVKQCDESTKIAHYFVSTQAHTRQHQRTSASSNNSCSLSHNSVWIGYFAFVSMLNKSRYLCLSLVLNSNYKQKKLHILN